VAGGSLTQFIRSYIIMADIQTLLKQAKAALKSQDKAKARELLLQVVDLDPKNEEGWLLMSGVVSSLEEQQICLENVLKVNPNNERAKKGAEMIAKKLGNRPAAAAPPTPAPSDDPWGGASADSADPWGAPASGGGYHGSGQSVPQPSADQYDDWIENIGLGKKDAAPSPFEADSSDSDPWGGGFDTPSSSADPWGGTPASSPQADPWGSQSADPWGGASASSPQADPWGTTPTTNNAFVDASDDDWGRTSSPDLSAEVAEERPSGVFTSPFDEEEVVDPFAEPPATSSPAFPQTGNSSIDFEEAFDFDDDSGFSFDDAFITDSPKKGDVFKPPKKEAKASNPTQNSRYFTYIPDQLKLKEAASASAPMLIGVFVLGILNVAALVGLLMAF
jgi:hypothetical protein